LTALYIRTMMQHVRTTVTLDPDVERLLREAARRSGKSFKEVLNRAVREALAPRSDARSSKPFRVKGRPMRLRAGIDAAALNRLLDEVEIEGFLERRARKR
jgi:hypothetical protein